MTQNYVCDERKIDENNRLFGKWVVGVSDYSGKNLFPARSDLVGESPVSANHILIAYKGANGASAERSKDEALAISVLLSGGGSSCP